MSNKVLGLDLGTNSLGWALLEETDGKQQNIIALGSRIFIKSVEEKTPTPKNVKRRDARMARRIVQRRAKRKQEMLDYLIRLKLLPSELQNHPQPEIVLNSLGNPYQLRALGLDEKLQPHQLGRVLLHLVQRRGFLSNRKILLGDMVDDPDVQAELALLENQDDNSSEQAKEETAFKADIKNLRAAIEKAECRTLGEYLSRLDTHDCKRNRTHNGGHLRTDRQMYREELAQIWQEQVKHHPVLTDDVKAEIEDLIFYQRPLKLQADRVGKCSLEPRNTRTKMARLEFQRFRYLQDINNLQYFNPLFDNWMPLDDKQRAVLVDLFEQHGSVSFAAIKKALGFKKADFNLEDGGKKKALKGNITASKIRAVWAGWDDLDSDNQLALVEDLLTIQKKSVLKNRLINHWQLSKSIAVNLCFLEFEAGHASVSLKAIRKLMPFLQQGEIYSDARVSAGYGYETVEIVPQDKLGLPPEIPNPIVQKALFEVRRVVNAVIAEHGKPDAIRIEMARELEMNGKKYEAFIKQQNKNEKSNLKAESEFKTVAANNPQLGLRDKASKSDKQKYRLWLDQKGLCAYSNQEINLATLFTAAVEVDHILPYSESLDDSYMNKVVCFAAENQVKGQRTPFEAFSGNAQKWALIKAGLDKWGKIFPSKTKRFYMTAAQVQERDFISSQLNDTRYISKETYNYVKQLGCDVSVSKGIVTSWLRHQWDLNSLLGETGEKDRSDHRHHAIDAVVIACTNRRFYQALVKMAANLERRGSALRMRDLHTDTPWASFRADLKTLLDNTIIAHTPQLKLSGELHEQTGAGFIEGVGNVHRKTLSPDFSQVEKIVDASVQAAVKAHLEKHGNNPKLAFAEGVTVFHKNGITPIKRVRIVQSKTSLKKLQESKFGVRDKQGKVFKWLSYGNLHHVEILREAATGKYQGEFVTMMLAHQRGKGIGMPKQPLIKTEHGAGFEFVMALHINEMVSVEKDGRRVFYRVQKLDQPGGLTLRLHTAASLDKDAEGIRKSISTLMAEFKMQKHTVTVLGKLS